VGCQGIGGAYTAGLAENLLPQNTAPQDIQTAVDMFNECNTKCPNAKIVAGGYRYVNIDLLYGLVSNTLLAREVPSLIMQFKSYLRE
jgi:hypothetical protein